MLPTNTATAQPTSTATVAASPTPAGQIADPITNAALTLSMSPAVSSQLQNLANQINNAVAAALQLGPPQDQYIYNAQRRVLDLWINTLVPLFVQQGQIPASSQAGVLDALIMVRNALP
jgi:hypothetical protein